VVVNMTSTEDYCKMHNSLIALYHNVLTGEFEREDVAAELKRIIEESSGITFEEASSLLHKTKED
jgi:hypothetical protein